MKNGRRDNAAWLLTSCFALPLVTMSIVWLNRPAPAPSHPATLMSAPASPPLPPIKDTDGDGDELLEHWNNPLFNKEQRLQLGGLTLFFAAAGTAALRRRTTLRRRRREA